MQAYIQTLNMQALTTKTLNKYNKQIHANYLNKSVKQTQALTEHQRKQTQIPTTSGSRKLTQYKR
eukprot:gene3276-2258_t